MTLTTIDRQPTEAEKRDWDGGDIANKEFTAKERFESELANEFQKAMKKNMPFCAQAARDDFNDHYELEKNKSVRKNGYLIKSEIKPFNADWKRYSDLNNFEVLEEGEVYDDNLSKRNPGISIMEKKTKYKFKGTIYTVTVMEGGDNAILRAKKKLSELNEEIKESGKKGKK